MFTKQHYIEVAKAIRSANVPPKLRRTMADLMAGVFAKDNPKFDHQRWNEAVENGLVRVRPNCQPHEMRSVPS